MNPNTSTALLWGGFALILLGFGGCVASGGMALTGAMDPRVYDTSIQTGATILRMSFLMMFVGFVAVVVGAVGKAVSAFDARNNIDQPSTSDRSTRLPPTPNPRPATGPSPRPQPTSIPLSSRGRMHYPDNVKEVIAFHNGNEIEVLWEAVANATGYDVMYSTDDNRSVWTSAVTDHTDTTYVLTGTDESVSYTFGVRAVRGSTRSNWTTSAPASK